MNIRIELGRLLTEAVPAGWTVVDHGVVLENPQKPYVVVRQQSLKRTAGAPRLYRDMELVVGLVEPGLDAKLIEDALDEDVWILLDIIEQLAVPGLVWTEATRTLFDMRFQGYDIHLTITTEKD